ncbi:YtxH domain-containing protein [Bacillus marasmi]|uniref:YtxH domain-containing protein n=1 Tax=Bacillus marasmi TaxID=1926279 RepID=UPI0011CC68FF|nr:YtxH domain-containing protein [Bacillus marasmi]
MGEARNFWKGVLLGALAGGALSLLDKPTRQAVTTNCKTATKKVVYVIKNPSEVVDKVKTTSEQVRQTVAQVSDDLYFIKEKVEEITEATPYVVNVVKETKDVFLDNKDTYTETEQDPLK